MKQQSGGIIHRGNQAFRKTGYFLKIFVKMKNAIPVVITGSIPASAAIGNRCIKIGGYGLWNLGEVVVFVE